MPVKLLWVRQYAHTRENMGRAHIAQEGGRFTLCGQSLRPSAVWGREYRAGIYLHGWCYTCAHRAQQQLARAGTA